MEMRVHGKSLQIGLVLTQGALDLHDRVSATVDSDRSIFAIPNNGATLRKSAKTHRLQSSSAGIYDLARRTS